MWRHRGINEETEPMFLAVFCVSPVLRDAVAAVLLAGQKGKPQCSLSPATPKGSIELNQGSRFL